MTIYKSSGSETLEKVINFTKMFRKHFLWYLF